MNNSVALNVERATVLPAAVYGPIPDGPVTHDLSYIPRVMGFVGRDNELSALDAAFTCSGAVMLRTVHGLGGVGKSALAAEWAACRATAAVRWWITADSAAAVDDGLAILAIALQPGLAELPTELQKERALHWLAGHDDWLLVLDNVGHPDHIRWLVGRVPHGQILITTRRATGWHQLATVISLGVLNPSDSVALFIQILNHDGPRDGDGTIEVCEELGHLALAIEQAAAFCAESGYSPRAYLDMLRQWPAETYAAGPEGSDSARTVDRIWRISLDRLSDTPLAGQILRILAWYSPDRIPRTLLDGLASPPILAAALGRLLAYSMITDNRDGTLSVHRLVQALARTSDPGDPHRAAIDINDARDHATGRLDRVFPTNASQPDQWPLCRALLPHVEALVRHSLPDDDTPATAHLLARAASFLNGQGSTTPAIRHLLRTLTTCERLFGEEHPATLVLRNNLAHAYQTAGDLARAIPLYERTLSDSARVLGAHHPETLTSQNNLAGAYESSGDLARATLLYERTFADSARILGEKHPHTLTSQNNLASAYQAAGDPARAILLYERTLTDSAHTLGESHPHTLGLRNNLAHAYESTGDLARAILLYEHTLTDSAHTLGEDHPNTLALRHNLAGAYQAAGDSARAIPLHERTVTDSARILGVDHPDTLISQNNLASAYKASGDLARAITLYEHTLATCERILGEEHLLTAAVRANLTAVYASNRPSLTPPSCPCPDERPHTDQPPTLPL